MLVVFKSLTKTVSSILNGFKQGGLLQERTFTQMNLFVLQPMNTALISILFLLALFVSAMKMYIMKNIEIIWRKNMYLILKTYMSGFQLTISKL